jgi:NtrC-family two-component system sensor histidine kinase KinB
VARRFRRRIALRVALAFLIVGMAWIALTDFVLFTAVKSPGLLTQLQLAKGWVFVALVSVGLYLLVHRSVAGLQAEEAKGHAILESIAEGVLLVGRDGRIEDANLAAVRMLGVSGKRELIGLGAPEFSRRFHLRTQDGQVLPPGRYVSQRALSGEATEPYRAVLRRSDGGRLVIASSAAPVRTTPGGRIEMSVSVMRDITRLHELEEARDHLYAAAAHSLKTPVAIIHGHAQLLAARCGPEVGASIRVIDRQSRRLDCLVQNLMVLTRLRGGALQLHPREVALDHLIRDALALEEPDPEHSRVRYEGEAELWSFADRERLQLVVRDLLELARGRSPPELPIELTLRRDGPDALIQVCYPRDVEQAPGALSFKAEPTPVGVEELELHTGLRVAPHVVATIVEAHGGTCGAMCDPQGHEADWVRVPLLQPGGSSDALH